MNPDTMKLRRRTPEDVKAAHLSPRRRGRELDTNARINLGLDVLTVVRDRTGLSAPLTQAEIAEVCGVHRGTIFMMERRAMQKLRNRAFLRNDPVLRELFQGGIS